MKLIASLKGQSLQLFRPDEIWPETGMPFLPDLILAVRARYSFAKIPEALPAPGEVMKFEVGKFEMNGTDIPIESIDIYNDGIIVNTARTEYSDAILDDLFSWAIDNFRFREPATAFSRRYVSQVVVELERELSGMLKFFDSLQRIYTDTYERTMGEKREFHIIQFAVSGDPNHPASTLFKIEARHGIPFSERQFFCTAPISTEDHLATLIALEREIQRI